MPPFPSPCGDITCMHVHAQFCLTLRPHGLYPLGSSVHGIFQARILEWVAISFSRGSSQPRDQTCISCIDRWILYHCTTWEAQHHIDSLKSAQWECLSYRNQQMLHNIRTLIFLLENWLLNFYQHTTDIKIPVRNTENNAVETDRSLLGGISGKHYCGCTAGIPEPASQKLISS